MWQNVTTSNYRFMKSQLLTVLTFIASAYPLEQTHLVEQSQVGLLSNQCSPTFRLEHSQGHLGDLQRGEVEGFGGFTVKLLTEQILSESLLIYNPTNYRSLTLTGGFDFLLLCWKMIATNVVDSGRIPVNIVKVTTNTSHGESEQPVGCRESQPSFQVWQKKHENAEELFVLGRKTLRFRGERVWVCQITPWPKTSYPKAANQLDESQKFRFEKSMLSQHRLPEKIRVETSWCMFGEHH